MKGRIVNPVPASDNLLLFIQNIEGQIDWCIEGVDGKSIRNFRVNNEKVEVDLNNIQRATYLIKFFQNGIYIKTQKIIKI